MRVLIMAKEGEQSDTATPPTPEAMAEYQKFNEELVKAGVVLEAGRLHPSSQSKRVRFDGKKRTVLDGPFTETKELVAGYWLWQVRSVDEALEWLKRAPYDGGTGHVEGAQSIGPRKGEVPVVPERRETAATEAHRAIEAIWGIESARLIAGLARIVGDIGLAEELAQDALVAALEQWPVEGVPERPGAWLMGTAKHRAIDLIRRRKTLERKHEQIGREIELAQEDLDLDTALDEEVGDDLLGLMFMACHPVLAKDARVALTLRVLGGLTTEEIARANLVPVSTIAQRIVRAKRTLAEAHVRFEIPGGAERVARLASVLEVIYLIFNEGYSATAGEDWVRPALCEEALRLGRILAELVPTEPEVHGLVALMEIQASRLRARVGATGEPVLLFDQDRARYSSRRHRWSS